MRGFLPGSANHSVVMTEATSNGAHPVDNVSDGPPEVHSAHGSGRRRKRKPRRDVVALRGRAFSEWNAFFMNSPLDIDYQSVILANSKKEWLIQSLFGRALVLDEEWLPSLTTDETEQCLKSTEDNEGPLFTPVKEGALSFGYIDEFGIYQHDPTFSSTSPSDISANDSPGEFTKACIGALVPPGWI